MLKYWLIYSRKQYIRTFCNNRFLISPFSSVVKDIYICSTFMPFKSCMCQKLEFSLEGSSKMVYPPPTLNWHLQYQKIFYEMLFSNGRWAQLVWEFTGLQSHKLLHFFWIWRYIVFMSEAPVWPCLSFTHSLAHSVIHTLRGVTVLFFGLYNSTLKLYRGKHIKLVCLV